MARVTTTRRRNRPTKTGVVLSHELIVRTAIRLIHEHGSEGLSVRRLGLALGADPSSVYRYFRNTDDLIRAVADDLIGQYLADFRPGPDLRRTLRDLGLRIHSALVAEPRISALTASRVTGRPHEISTIEVGLGILRAAGFTPAEAARHYHAFIDLTLGFAALDASAAALPHDTDTADDAAWTTVYARLGADTHPNIAACSDALAATMRTSAYPAALDLFLDGLIGRTP
ncbi:TetR/AcrR family transcriptional regulator [Cryptosporangium phraense]|uniref:TetR family transcriptional regulator n=1 Tax=Cryptosporangium phraense TaxID=2593070 RepID=A0A545AH84_9ACTN|nr:TetR/AcrR family transcriptional regulator [Cryptosporangium phraense]TQS40677.1 TetR family transcriptional regulator [Cryptosporangium phraense]